MAAYTRQIGVKYISDISRPNVLRSLLKKQQYIRTLRKFCSSESGGVPLNEPLPNVLVKPRSSLIPRDTTTYETKITTLENGLKVASEESFGQFSTVGGTYSRI